MLGFHSLSRHGRRRLLQIEVLEDRCMPSILTLLATLDGSHEVPPNMSAAHGTATIAFDTTANQVGVDAFITGIPLANVSQFHFHQDAIGTQGPDLLDLLPFGHFMASGSGIRFTVGNIPFPASAVSALLSGETSLEVHTTLFPNGEIEGPVVPQPMLTRGEPVSATGADAGGAPEVKVFDAHTGALKLDFFAFDPAFHGGVRVAVGDVNGDGIPDLIVAPGPGAAPEVKVFDGQTGAEVRDFFAFTPLFTGGLFVAAGDLNHDGFADVIAGMDGGGPPEVRGFSGLGNAMLYDFFAFNPAFTGGVRVAAADVNGDGFADIITGAGPGAAAAPEVKVFSGLGGARVQDYLAYNAAFTGGVFVAAGDVNGDGRADIITGMGQGGLPEVKVFSGTTTAPLKDFFAFEPAGWQSGVRVGAVDTSGIGEVELLAIPGSGQAAELKNFDAVSLTALDDFFAFDPAFRSGAFTAGS